MSNVSKTTSGVTVFPTVVSIETGEVIREYPECKNMLTDWGLNHLAVQSYPTMMNVCALGTGTTPTNRGSGVAVISQIGDRITSDIPFFVADDELYWRVIQLDNDKSYRVLEFISPTEVRVDAEDTHSNGECVVWSVEQTKLDTYNRRSATYNTELVENNGSTVEFVETTPDLFPELTETAAIPGGYTDIDMWRTFQLDFISDVVSVTITEAGWGCDNVTNPNLFGRILFPTPLVMNPGERLLLKVVLNRKLNKERIGNGGPFDLPMYVTPGAHTSEMRYIGVFYINSAGNTVVPDSSRRHAPPCEFHNNPWNYTSIQAGDTATYIDKTLNFPEYVHNSFTRVIRKYFDPTQRTGKLRYIGTGLFDSTAHCCVFRYPEPYPEIPENTLIEYGPFEFSWDRKLPPFSSFG